MSSLKIYAIAIIALIVGAASGWMASRKWPAPVSSFCNEANVPKHALLSFEQARRYVENYAKQVDTIPVDGPRGVVDLVSNTRCIWFDKSRIRDLICQLDQDGGDGMRFYFATYDNTYSSGSLKSDALLTEPPPVPAYWGRNTLVIVSTRDKVDYFGDSTLPAGTQQRKGFLLTIEDQAENHGELCPPPAKCYGARLLKN
jgi:hypothetical protein